ncbi:hypothetical protein [Nocardioides ungokensis]|uniref:hypothetical protein n=1 Tax=Nocardioides ungokensis TaxID=1643322 RepID=UPI0015DE027C|nr:hypothetical protein [Nocardioides ungokensis]
MIGIRNGLGSITDRKQWGARGATFVAKVKATKAVWFPPEPVETGKKVAAAAGKTAKKTTGTAKKATGSATKKSTGAPRRRPARARPPGPTVSPRRRPAGGRARPAGRRPEGSESTGTG